MVTPLGPWFTRIHQDPSMLPKVGHHGWPSAGEKSECLKIPPHVPQVMIKLPLKCIHWPHSNHIIIQPVPLLIHPIRKLEPPNIQPVPSLEQLEAMPSSTIISLNLMDFAGSTFSKPLNLTDLNRILKTSIRSTLKNLVSKVVRHNFFYKLFLLTTFSSCFSSVALDQKMTANDPCWLPAQHYLLCCIAHLLLHTTLCCYQTAKAGNLHLFLCSHLYNNRSNNKKIIYL